MIFSLDFEFIDWGFYFIDFELFPDAVFERAF